MQLNHEYTPVEIIESKIYFIRGKKVMLDRDLALLYGVETRSLNQAVKRNRKRFPNDFMFELSLSEASNLRSQIVISSLEHGGRRWQVFVFTELGIAMLSSVLKSERAILVNIQIMRTFTKLRELLASNDELRLKLEEMERRYDGEFKIVFDTLRQLVTPVAEPQAEIGFRLNEGPV